MIAVVAMWQKQFEVKSYISIYLLSENLKPVQHGIKDHSSTAIDQFQYEGFSHLEIEWIKSV